MMRRAYNRSGLSVVALYGVIYAVSEVISGIIIGGYLGRELADMILSHQVDVRSLLSFLQTDEYQDLVMIGAALGSALGLGAGLFLMKAILPKERYSIPVRDLTGRELIVVILATYGLWGVGAFIGNLPSFFGVYGMDMAIKNRILNFLFCLYAVLGAPVLEELAFRKFLLDRIHPFGETVAALTSALLFGLFHGNAAQFPLAFGVGFISATVYMKTGRIAYSILLHMMINLTGTLLELFGLIGIDVSLGWYIAVAGLMIAGVIVFFVNWKKELFTLEKPRDYDANRQAFKNPGMLIAVIGGLVLMGITELMLFINSISIGDGFAALLRFLPIGIAVAITILVITRAGRNTEPAAPVSGEVMSEPAETIEETVSENEAVTVLEDATEQVTESGAERIPE